MYFTNFPVIAYDSVGNGDFKLVTNLMKRVALRSKVRANVLLFDTYDVKDGETPEFIAHKLYDDSNLHWVIMYVNSITDRYHQWPLSSSQFLAFVNDKYSDPNGTHHYEITQTLITNYEYEESRQDALRKIRLLDPQYVDQFVDEFNKLIGESIL